MKIKTSTNTVNKTAPAPPPPTLEPVTVSVGRTKTRGCTWTCCDFVLLTIVVIMFVGAIVLPTGMGRWYGRHEDDEHHGKHGMHHGKHGMHHGKHHGHYVASPIYVPATCRVAEIIEQGEVCCGSKCGNNCKAGQRASLDRARWYKFQDEATNDRRLCQKWEQEEEFDRREFEEMESLEEELMGEMMEDDREEHDRQKRSYSERRNYYQTKSFTCYKVVLEGRKHGEPHRAMTDLSGERDNTEGHQSSEEGYDSAEEGHDSSEEWEHRRDHREGHRHRRSHHEESREEPHEEDAEEDAEPEKQELLSRDFEPEAGIVVVEGPAHEDNVHKATFYEGQHTMENYMQCSYSACSSHRCQNNREIEEKMKKWKMRFDTQETFDCSVLDEHATQRIRMTEEEDDSSEEEDDIAGCRARRIAKFLVIPYIAILATLFCILATRRCKVYKAQLHARSLKYASQKSDAESPKMTKEQEANLPPLAIISKEEEANMPPSAPPTAWTLPDYGKSSELPPVYSSTPDIAAVVALSVAKEAEEQKGMEKDSEA